MQKLWNSIKGFLRSLKSTVGRDIPKKIVMKIDITTLYHFVRDGLYCSAFVWATQIPSVGFAAAFSFALAWELQDGNHNDGFDVMDFLAGVFGASTAILIFTTLGVR